MAAGCLLLGNRDAAPCSGQQNGNVLEDTIDRLKRCLRFASTDDDDEKPTSPSLSSSVAEESPSHDGHMCTDDSPRSDSSASGTTDGVLFHSLTNGNSNNHHAASSNSTNHVSSHSSVIHFDDRYEIVCYKDESQIGDIMNMITKDLSEPYSIYTYRYFIHNWPGLCFLATEKSTGINVGAVVCKMDVMDDNRRRGYVAMLVVDKDYRCHGIGTRLVMRALSTMQDAGCDEVVLETEVTNVDAQRLYENLGFIREKRLFRYYLNGVDAFRLKLFFTPPPRKLRSPLL